MSRNKKPSLTPEEQEARIRQEWTARYEARMAQTLTRGEVVEALEGLAAQHEFYGDHDSSLIAGAFRALAEVLS